MADQMHMTAVAMATRLPVAMPAVDLGRPAKALREPGALSALVLVGLLAVLAARHPLAQAIGTEVASSSPAAVVDAGATTERVPAVREPQPAAVLPAVPTHAPRDPFHPRVVDHGPAAAPASFSPVAPAAPAAVAPSHSLVVAEADRYVVRPGESLWGIAQQLLGTSASVAAVQQRVDAIFTRNAAVIGVDPSLIQAGQVLDLSGMR